MSEKTRKILAIDRVHELTAAKKLVFGLCANHSDQPHFKAKILLPFVLANEASEDD